MSEVDNNEPWVEASQDVSTFAKGGNAAKLDKKNLTVVKAYTLSRPMGGESEEKDKVQTYVYITHVADGETDAVEDWYKAGDGDHVLAGLDGKPIPVGQQGNGLLTRKGVLHDSTQYAQYVAALEAAGRKLETKRTAELVGLRYESVAVAKKWEMNGRKGETVKIHAKKFLGVATTLPQTAATQAPLQAAGGATAEAIREAVVTALMVADNNTLKITELTKAVAANFAKEEATTIARSLIDKTFKASIEGVVFEGSIAKLAA